MSILIAPTVLVGLALLLGAGLLWARSRLPSNDDALTDAIDALLPQTQCAQCGYPGCRPYAAAVAHGAPVDLCPPGGKETVAALRNLLGEGGGELAAKPQNPIARQPAAENADALHDVRSPSPTVGMMPGGVEHTDADSNLTLATELAGNRTERGPQAIADRAASGLVAKVREPECVGCALCLKACPVDAIIGAPGFLHSVLERQCTGCELCLPACPVDCIDLVPTPIQALHPPAAAATKRHRTLPPLTAADAPCIGCNRCEDVCPEGLAPQHLLRLLRAGQSAQAAAADLGNCIECRLCDRACPTQIPLAGIFRRAKAELAQRAAKDANAAAAKARFDARTARLAEQEAAAAARRAERLTRRTTSLV